MSEAGDTVAIELGLVEKLMPVTEPFVTFEVYAVSVSGISPTPLLIEVKSRATEQDATGSGVGVGVGVVGTGVEEPQEPLQPPVP